MQLGCSACAPLCSESSCMGEEGAGLGAFGEAGRDLGRVGGSGVQRAVTWYGGQAQICVRDPLFHPPLGVWPCTLQVRGEQQPPPGPPLAAECDTKWKASLPGGVPRDTSWVTALGGPSSRVTRGEGEPQAGGTPGTGAPHAPWCCLRRVLGTYRG